MEIIKAAVLGVFVCLVALVLKKNQPGLSVLLILAGNFTVLTLTLHLLSPVVQWVKNLNGFLSAESFGCLLKALGIALIAQLAQELCRDAGTQSIGFSIGLCARLLILLSMLPVLNVILTTISGWLL